MTPITKEQAVQVAREAGATALQEPSVDFLLRFAQASCKLGRNAGLEDAKQALLAEPVVLIQKWRTAEVIESLKDNTP